jgi:hypothetical protein
MVEACALAKGAVSKMNSELTRPGAEGTWACTAAMSRAGSTFKTGLTQRRRDAKRKNLLTWFCPLKVSPQNPS